MTRGRWKSIGLLAGMFVLGGVCGAGAMRAFSDREMTEIMQESPDAARAKFRMRAMARQLDLSPQQRAQGMEIFEKYRNECDAADRKVRAKQAECRRQARDEMLEILTPEQRAKHERVTKRRQKRKRNRGGRP